MSLFPPAASTLPPPPKPTMAKQKMTTTKIQHMKQAEQALVSTYNAKCQ